MADHSTFLAELPNLAKPVGRGDYRFHASDGTAIGFAQFIPWGANTIKLHRLFAYSSGQGHGSTMLRALCELADRHDVEIRLNALPFGQKPYHRSRQQLVEWYGRHGFVGKPKCMVRKPRGAGAAAVQSNAMREGMKRGKDIGFLLRLFRFLTPRPAQ